jgi:tyrosyl-tRNA synthetase
MKEFKIKDDGGFTNFYGGKIDNGYKLKINGEQTPVEFLQEQYNQCPKWEEQIHNQDWEKAKEMEHLQKKILNEALETIRKFVTEFDEEGEVSWNTRDDAKNFLETIK